MVQSFLLRGDQIFHPVGHEFGSVLLDTFKPLVTFWMKLPVEYPGTGILVTLQFAALPAAHFTEVWCASALRVHLFT